MRVEGVALEHHGYLTDPRGKSVHGLTPDQDFAGSGALETGKEGRAQVACTYGDNSGVKYPVGIYADHCYTLRGIHRVGTKVFVQLRNPWGPGSATDAEPTEPMTDGVQDALFEISQADFARLYNSVDIVP